MYESQFEQELYELRRQKLRQIGELGQKAGLSEAESKYPNSYAATHTVPELRAAFDAKTTEELERPRIDASIAGRVMAIRVQGKAGFAQLQQGGVRIQIYVRKDDVGEDAFAMYKLLDLGDHIGVKGYLMRTRTGELTVHVSALTFLAKAMLALPDKYHGLEDTELRYRQRYVDLFMNTGHAPRQEPSAPNALSSRPEAPHSGDAAESPATPATNETPPAEASINVREIFVKRAAVLRAIRKFFDERGYLEVETPMLHTIAGGAAARPFKTHHNALNIPLSLRIAPELYLKRLVVGGLDRVYEINRNFRNEGVSTRHNPEFTMLEFYQAYANYHELMELTQELIISLAIEVNGTPVTNFHGQNIDLSKWTKLSMVDAIRQYWPASCGEAPSTETLRNAVKLAIHLEQVGAEVVEKNLDAVWSSATGETVSPGEIASFHGSAFLSLGQRLAAGESKGKVVAELFEHLGESPFENHLIQPTIIYDFPLAVSPLSKIKPDEPDWVERFEFYIGGFEIGNAFSELNDPDDQRARFLQQLAERDRGDDEAHAMDEDYVRALGYGMPPTAGEGIGIDRLTMILTGAKSIRDVILFPLMRPLTKAE